jgi:hypothetical protein
MPGFEVAHAARRAMTPLQKATKLIWSNPLEIGLNLILLLLLVMAIGQLIPRVTIDCALGTLENATRIEQQINYLYEERANYTGLSVDVLAVGYWAYQDQVSLDDIKVAPATVNKHNDSFTISLLNLSQAACIALVNQGHTAFGSYTQSFMVNGGAPITPTAVAGLKAAAFCFPGQKNTLSLISVPGPLRDVQALMRRLMPYQGAKTCPLDRKCR